MDLNTLIENAIAWAFKNVERADYPFKSLAFVEDAYEFGNRIEMFGGDCAAESAQLYAPLHSGAPARGAFVFYRAEGQLGGVWKDWGHVGLALGNGQVIHSWNRIRTDGYLGLQALTPAPGWLAPIYLGWVPPEIFLASAVGRARGSS
jgi:hypothetical protein